MFSTDWQTSGRQYEISIHRDVRIPVDDGITLDSDIFRPDEGGKFPAILAVHPYPKAAQSMAMIPEGNGYARAFIEASDFNFYVRRGYAFIIVNIRGSFGSDGFSAISIRMPGPCSISARPSSGWRTSPGATAI
ncbi:MAG: CocE/NonD family hydrolase [Rhodospirillales bacterium]|jgi:hypothetical protein|nr:CocE/NonD family hydrolase [Rhodospirillales bacterium]